jgi:drug/metabolite transporter (DMT)-like permease
MSIERGFFITRERPVFAKLKAGVDVKRRLLIATVDVAVGGKLPVTMHADRRRASCSGMVLILLGSAFLWALGSIVSQPQSPSVPATTSAGMQLICGGTALLVASSLKGELVGFSSLQISPSSWAGLGYLTLAGSVVAFTAYVWLLDYVPAPLVATYTFVNPIIAVGLGWALLGERLTLPMLAGFLLVVASVIAVWRLEAP